ncbi:MAG: 5-formyltetrahydrofolate cyclo-ligase [Clostridiales bacterium]|nr:5-formyltetrahydrofolate cyclo-ligase [Clostridiales bacterium]
MEVKERKKELRKKIRVIDRSLTPDYCREASRIICQKITRLEEYKKASMVFCFVGVGAEPDTTAIIEDALHRGKRVCLPLCIDDTTMQAMEITDIDKDLVPGAYYDIPEPRQGLPVVDVCDIDFALIPCVTCDHKGNRLGHGKGYYDRYLADTGFRKAMICYEKRTVAEGEIPVEEFDKTIETVVTDAE